MTIPTNPTCPKCQSYTVQREERQRIYLGPFVSDPIKLMWHCLIPACKHIWPALTW